MKKIKFLRKYVIIVLAILLMGACKKDENSAFDVKGDVVFIKKKVNNQPVTGTGYYAYANKTLNSCTVTPPNTDQSINLSAFETNTLTFFHEPSDNEFSSSAPVEGIYSFNATSSDNETIEVSDEQSYYGLGFAQITEKTFDTQNNVLDVTWEEVTGADSYAVSLVNSAGEVIFNGYKLSADSREYLISTNYDSGVWKKLPSYDETFSLRINCFKFDSDATEDNYLSSIQEISQSDYPIVWKLN